MAGVSSVFAATCRPLTATCRAGFGCDWVWLWLLYCYKICSDLAPKLYHNFDRRVKRKCRRLSTLNRRLSGSFWNATISVTMLVYINDNGLGSITTYVALQHGGRPAAPVLILVKWKILTVRQWASYSSAKICWSAPTL